ncbi:MAG: hypothetical protein ABSA02_38210 [Trebonia sp.]
MSIDSNHLWADRAFGSDADALREVIRKSLTAASTQSQNAQSSSRARKKYPFGSSLWTLQFQELEDRMVKKFGDRVRIVPLDNYSLAVFDSYVLYPVRSANLKSSKAKEGRVRKPVSKLRRQMYSVLGPEPIQDGLWPEQAAQESVRDLRTLMTRLGPSARLASISYVCDYKTGLVDIYWGDAELDARSGELSFRDGEEVPVVVKVAKPVRKRRRDVGVSAFDGGEMPRINLGINVTRQPSSPEAEPVKPMTSSHEEE